ncbi:monooxygenase flavin-binding family protein-like protein [Calycina marina]|uniref:Monooxygenase flavin-binding family protein-like protein n=1 Tax=Calycina marina TaxID=1763456 RepID=A0A9P8CJJ8_9HELO|nr:monooxygenase flavin-binding family protein-like protein [Calycina marina]
MVSTNVATTDLDIIIVGAGVSGVNAAHRIQNNLPNSSYTILESRDVIGGTWDLFSYPGIRSDSDMFTFGFHWYPWTSDRIMSSGPGIKDYISKAAEVSGIAEKIRFRHTLVSGDWSTAQQRWTLMVDLDGDRQKFTARFLVMSTGYYDYGVPLQTEIPGIGDFGGKVIHTQFWPTDYDYTDKKIIIVGSGATAITLLPALTEKAASVTMLQRSPSYIISVEGSDPHATFLHKYFPVCLSSKLMRIKYILIPVVLSYLAGFCPTYAKKMVLAHTWAKLPAHIPHDPHFLPVHQPWEQRVCACPDEDFFEALHNGKGHVVTDKIDTVTKTGIKTKKGTILKADTIITATGLKLRLLGGAQLSIDGKIIDHTKKYFWRSSLLQDLPNVAVVLGYTNSSWTLGSEIAADLVCRLIKHMDKKHLASVAPKVPLDAKMERIRVPENSATYMKHAEADMPLGGDRGPWKGRNDYISDQWITNYGPFRRLVKDLEFVGKVI